MEHFTGRIAVVTGGGTGMGRELVRQLSAEGCHVALCDVNEGTMDETVSLAEKEAPAGTRLTTFVADVSDAGQMMAFRAPVTSPFGNDHVPLVFNHAASVGGGSFPAPGRDPGQRAVR